MNKNTIPTWEIKGNNIPLYNLTIKQLETAEKICNNPNNISGKKGIEVRRTLKVKKLVDELFTKNIAFINNRVKVY